MSKFEIEKRDPLGNYCGFVGGCPWEVSPEGHVQVYGRDSVPSGTLPKDYTQKQLKALVVELYWVAESDSDLISMEEA